MAKVGKNGPTFHQENTHCNHGSGEFAWKVVATSQVQENMPQMKLRLQVALPHRHPICQPLAANGQSLFLLSVEDDSPQEKSHFRSLSGATSL